jgi:hypothetical protein
MNIDDHKALLARIRALELAFALMAKESPTADSLNLLLRQCSGSIVNQSLFEGDVISAARDVAAALENLRRQTFGD